jgi:hypothetical protein
MSLAGEILTKGVSLRLSGSQPMYALILLSGVSLFLCFLALSEDPNLPRRH